MNLVRSKRWLWTAFGIVLCSLVAEIAPGQEVIRISSYKARFGRNAEISKVTDDEITGVYAGMKGLKWVKFYYDPTSGERGSVTLWADRAALDAYMKSDVRKDILAKLRPLIEGDVTSRIYVVYAPGSSSARP
jgi:quinol monooxygenase YgiN